MFCPFKLEDVEFNEKDFQTYYDKGQQILIEQANNVDESIQKYLNTDGSLSATDIESDWFPQIDADVFISHSHKDCMKVVVLIGYLSTLGLKIFADFLVWDYYVYLLKRVDDNYCLKRTNQNGKHVYDYNIRNKSTAYVQTILNSALMKMIDKTECLIILETPNSIKIRELNSVTTESCWIYSELLMSNCLRRKEPKRAQKHNISNRFNLITDKKPLIVEYRVDTSHMVPITLKDFEKASNNGENLGLDLLDQLYINKELVRGINLYGEENGKED